jgi:ABC-type enterochelin transport system permease subunit
MKSSLSSQIWDTVTAGIIQALTTFVAYEHRFPQAITNFCKNRLQMPDLDVIL